MQCKQTCHLTDIAHMILDADARSYFRGCFCPIDICKPYPVCNLVGAGKAYGSIAGCKDTDYQAAVKGSLAVKKDFEVAAVHESATYKDAQGIVARDLNGFKKSKIHIYSPGELLLMLDSKISDHRNPD